MIKKFLISLCLPCFLWMSNTARASMDIYTGTLTRYYAANWKTTTQQWCEANGVEYQRTSSEEEEDNSEPMSPEEVQKTIEDWRNGMLSALAKHFNTSLPAWKEDNVRPYYTEKMDWTAYEALRLYIACKTYGEPLPPKFKPDNLFSDFDIAERVNNSDDLNWSLFMGVSYWLPLDYPFVIGAVLPTNSEIMLSSTGALQQELEHVNTLGWNADEKTILEWNKTEGYTSGDIETGELADKSKTYSLTEGGAYDTESLAKYAFSVFYKAVKFSKENNVPILMDF